MSRPLWFVDIIKHLYTDRFQIAGWTKKSRWIRSVVDFFLFDKDEIYYLVKNEMMREMVLDGKAHSVIHYDHAPQVKQEILERRASSPNIEVGETISINQVIEKPDDMTLPSDVVRFFIEQANNIWINYKCICRDSMQCKDYPVDLGCIFMGDAVLRINPELGRLVTKEEALGHLAKTDELGFVHMVGRNKIDTQWMGISPGDKLLSVCQCCPCCCLYRVMPDLDRSISSKITKMPGVDLTLDESKCIGCGSCEAICFTSGISLIDGVAELNDLCVGCARCVEVCDQHAISIRIDETYMTDTVDRLAKRVDVT